MTTRGVVRLQRVKIHRTIILPVFFCMGVKLGR